MKKLLTLLALGLSLSFGAAHAADEKAATPQQTKMKTCNADAKTKSLKGDERKAFMKDCLSATPVAAAEPVAAPSQQTKMKTCNADTKAKTLKGDERKTFMKECLSK
ncbi:MAG: PsiF family protein [Rhodoferax sp.]